MYQFSFIRHLVLSAATSALALSLLEWPWPWRSKWSWFSDLGLDSDSVNIPVRRTTKWNHAETNVQLQQIVQLTAAATISHLF